MAMESHIAAVEFSVAADQLIGERVTLEDCHLVFATESEATCLGFIPQPVAAGATAPLRRVLIRLADAGDLAKRQARGLCDGGALDDACHVSVSGVVEDQSSDFGVSDRHVLGLREGTINWPD
jgi:predicted trehalose synthase